MIQDKERLIEMRAQGVSYDKIAQELNKSKQTLINWSNDLKEEIANRRALELEALYEKFYLLKEKRISLFGTILGRIKTELDNRDLEKIPTHKLFELFIKYYDLLKREFIELNFKDSKEIQEEKTERALLDMAVTPQEKELNID